MFAAPRLAARGAAVGRTIGGATLVSALIGGGLALAALPSAGAEAALSAAVGAVTAIVFFAAGALVLGGRLDRGIDPMALVWALAVYAAQLGLLWWLRAGVAQAVWLRGAWLAWGAFAVVIAWQVVSVVAVLRTRRLIFTAPLPGEPASEGAR